MQHQKEPPQKEGVSGLLQGWLEKSVVAGLKDDAYKCIARPSSLLAGAISQTVFLSIVNGAIWAAFYKHSPMNSLRLKYPRLDRFYKYSEKSGLPRLRKLFPEQIRRLGPPWLDWDRVIVSGVESFVFQRLISPLVYPIVLTLGAWTARRYAQKKWPEDWVDQPEDDSEDDYRGMILEDYYNDDDYEDERPVRRRRRRRRKRVYDDDDEESGDRVMYTDEEDSEPPRRRRRRRRVRIMDEDDDEGSASERDESGMHEDDYEEERPRRRRRRRRRKRVKEDDDEFVESEKDKRDLVVGESNRNGADFDGHLQEERPPVSETQE